jgi:SAM-dependent methyltransferase
MSDLQDPRAGELVEPRERWLDPEAGERYAGGRWRSARRRARDPRRIASLLDRHLAAGGREAREIWLLDAPSGNARLRGLLEERGRWVGLDVSPSMLASAGRSAEARQLCGDVERLPFRDGSFDAVVCCRLLHHLREEAAFRHTLAELVRVSSGLVVASFWDCACLAEVGARRRHRARGEKRCARSKAFVRQAFAAAGAEVLEFRHSLRFLSRQSYVAARKRSR